MRINFTEEEIKNEANKVYIEDDDVLIEGEFIEGEGRHFVITGKAVIEGETYHDFETEFSAGSAALLINHRDEKGVISKITGILSEAGLNIAVMKLSRRSKGDMAFCVIETDGDISRDVVRAIQAMDAVWYVRAINKTDWE